MSYRSLNTITKDDRVKPIDNYEDIATYMENPPIWGKYTKPRSTRSKAVKNRDLIDGNGFDYFCHANPDAIVEAPRYETVAKTLICHDLKNGYSDDSYLNGTEDYTAYHFYHWAAIDIFCYFSHHFITIPPLGWINTAHEHGVKIIGTIITEWNEGYSIVEKILASEETYKQFAQNLTAIAKYYKLDGWLLNIENQVRKPDRLIQFVSYFRTKLHEEIPGSELIWYDSVTVKGSLQWQNKLNELNMEYFKASDGIFLNYSWYEEDLKISLDNSGDRKYDVYVGIDIWGRNFWGGGQFNTDVALSVVKKYDLSLAIFAFAWTHECISSTEVLNNHKLMENKEPGEKAKVVREVAEKRKASNNSLCSVSNSETFIKNAFFKEFLLRENAFWDLCWPFLYSRGPTNLPFRTSFCRGQGEKKRIFGEVVSENTWFNMRHTHYQLSYPQCGFSHELVEISKTSDEEITKEKSPNRCNKQNLPFEDSGNPNNPSISSSSEINVSVTDSEDLEVITKDKGKKLKRDASRSPRQSLINNQELDEDQSTTRCLGKVAVLLGISNHKRSKASIPNNINNLNVGKMENLVPVKEVNNTVDDNKFESSNLIDSGNESVSTTNEMDTMDDDVKSALNVLDTVTHDAEEEARIKDKLSNSSKVMLVQELDKPEVTKIGKKPPIVRKKAVAGKRTKPCIENYYSDSYIGGSCLIVLEPSILPGDNGQTSAVKPSARLINKVFICEFECKKALIVYIVTKRLPNHGEQSLNIHLKMKSNISSVVNNIVLSGKEWDNALTRCSYEHHADYVLYPVSRQIGTQFKEIQSHLLLNYQEFYVSVENDFGWEIKYYMVGYPETTLTEVQCELDLKSGGPILLGYLGICPGPA